MDVISVRVTSTLNPHAAPYVPAAYRAVEDFSDEWWDLVNSSPWFRDYWMRECFQEEPEASDLDFLDIYDHDLDETPALFHSYPPSQAIFRSLLYEACGRIVNPIYGSVGLLWSGNWQLCQTAVESVLKGSPIVQVPSEAAATNTVPPLKAYDVRHVIKPPVDGSKPAVDLHKVNKTRNPFKRTGTKSAAADSGRVFERAKSHESSGSHVTETGESLNSIETVEASHVTQGEPVGESCVELELTLGFEPTGRFSHPVRATPVEWSDDACHVDLGLKLHA